MSQLDYSHSFEKHFLPLIFRGRILKVELLPEMMSLIPFLEIKEIEVKLVNILNSCKISSDFLIAYYLITSAKICSRYFEKLFGVAVRFQVTRIRSDHFRRYHGTISCFLDFLCVYSSFLTWWFNWKRERKNWKWERKTVV